jgi:O-antigen ligase
VISVFVTVSVPPGSVVLTAVLVVAAVGAVLKVGDYFAAGEDRAGLGHLVGRLTLYQAALAILRESPLFGAWPGGWQIALVNLQLPGAQYGVSVHSMLLSVAVEWGIPMALLLVLAVGLSLRSGLRVVGRMRGGRTDASREMLRSTGCAVAACSVGLFVHGLTEIVPPYLVFLNLGIGVAIDRLAHAETEGGALGRPGPHS